MHSLSKHCAMPFTRSDRAVLCMLLYYRYGVRMHELGHNLGLHHSGWMNSEGVAVSEYGDPSAVLGSGPRLMAPALTSSAMFTPLWRRAVAAAAAIVLCTPLFRRRRFDVSPFAGAVNAAMSWSTSWSKT